MPDRSTPVDLLAGETFIRTVGRRVKGPRSTGSAVGAPPSAEARASMAKMAEYRTRVPKGVFRYSSHEEANRDWELWTVAGMKANSRAAPNG